MISWIQNTFQHHFRIIFAVLLAVIIISFVTTIGTGPGIGRGEKGAVQRPFFGMNLAAAADSQHIMGDAQISVLVAYGASDVDRDKLEKYAFQRYAAVAQADALHLPTPSAEEIAKFVKTLRRFQDKDGNFDPAAYSSFKDSIKGNPRLRESDIFRVLADDYRAESVQKLFAGPGYVIPADVRMQIAQAQTTWGLAIATIPYDSFNPKIAPSDLELSTYYDDNKARYEQAPRFSGSQIFFPASAYLDKVTITEPELQKFYTANKARFTPAPKSGEEAKVDEIAAFQAARPQVEAVYKLDRARRFALKEAADLSVYLFDRNATKSNLPEIVASRGYKLTPIKPFSRTEAPADLGGSQEASRQAFKLGKDFFFSDGIALPTGACIIVWDETLPSSQPELSQVRDKVLADYVSAERRKRFAEAGKKLQSAVKTSLKTGSQFSTATEAAANAAGLKVTFRTPAAFTLRQPPRDLPYSVFGALETLEKGGVSEVILSDEAGVLVYAAEKDTPSIQEGDESYLQTRTQLAAMAANTTGGAIIGEMVDRELNREIP